MIARVVHPPRASAGGNQEYALTPETVLVVEENGAARLLNLDGEFCAVDPVGTDMLLGTLDHGTRDLPARIATKYGEEELTHIEGDLHRFLSQLEQHGFICRADTRRSPGFGRASIASFLVRPLVALMRSSSPLPRAPGLLAIAWLFIRLFGWPSAVEAFRRHSVGAIKDTLPPAGRAKAVAMIDEMIRAAAARHLLRMECKERALCSWISLRMAGIPAKLLVGVDLYPFSSHCWCEVDGRVVSDFEDRCRNFTPVRSYG